MAIAILMGRMLGKCAIFLNRVLLTFNPGED